MKSCSQLCKIMLLCPSLLHSFCFDDLIISMIIYRILSKSVCIPLSFYFNHHQLSSPIVKIHRQLLLSKYTVGQYISLSIHCSIHMIIWCNHSQSQLITDHYHQWLWWSLSIVTPQISPCCWWRHSMFVIVGLFTHWQSFIILIIIVVWILVIVDC